MWATVKTKTKQMTTVDETTTTSTFSVADDAEYLQYRELSMGAVASLVLGIISFTAIPFVSLALIPLFGIFFGYRAVKQIRQRPAELTGLTMARIGMILSSVLFVGSIGWWIVEYSTEVPENYTRVVWPDLQPDPEKRPDLPVSPEAVDLNGEQVFIKGYVYPGDRKKGLKTFILVPDRGTCCFGGQPPLTHMIEVRLQEGKTIDYSFMQRKLGGILKVDLTKKPISGLDGVYYQLDADHLK